MNSPRPRTAAPPQRSLLQRIAELERQNLELGRTLQFIEEARSHYADHYDFAPLGCLTLDSHGCIHEINLAAARLLGRGRATLAGVPLFPFVEKPHVPAFLAHLRACKRSREKVVTEIALGAKSRAARLVELSSVPVLDPRTERTMYRTVLFDVTERRRAEKALRQSEERFSKAFRASPSAISISTLAEGRFVDANASFCKLTGYARADVIGRSALELHLFPDPELRARLAGEFSRIHTLQNLEGRLKMKSGGFRDVLMSAELIELEGVECVLMIGQDVTELKQLQRDVLEASEREKRRIGQDLHDDACQSLIGIAVSAEVLARQMAPEQPESAARVREIAGLLKDTIDRVSRLASGMFPVKIERYGLAWALEELAVETSTRWNIHSSFTMAQPVEIADHNISMHLYRIAQEALSNAARHGQATEIAVELKGDSQTASLVIRDNGCGLPRKPGKGGLGLQSMQYRAQLIGGTLQINNALQRGTVVTCSFPKTETTNGHEPDR